MSTTHETIYWHDALTKLPDDGLSVLCFADDEVFEGFTDGGNDDGTPHWCAVNAWEPRNVTHWAEMPEGPV